MAQDEPLTEIKALGKNKDNLRYLREQFLSRNSIVPFVGAGLSIPFGFRGWSQFLLAQARDAGIEAQIQTRIAAGEFEQAADDLFVALRASGLDDAIDSEYGKHRLESKPLDGAVALLPRLAPGPVITTNFDHVLERAFQDAGNEFAHISWGVQENALERALKQNQHSLIKLHGDASERTGRILRRVEYDKHYGTLGADVARGVYKILFSRTLLFIGCSLNDDRWMQVLRLLAPNDPALRHYAIVEKPTDDEKFHQRRSLFAELNIRPIWFPHGEFEWIEKILAWLAASVPASVPTPSKTALTSRNRRLRDAEDSLLAHPTGFFGRPDEVRAALEFLERGEGMATVTAAHPHTPRESSREGEDARAAQRIYSVRGAAGMGKSEVCKEALRQFLRAHPNVPAYFVELIQAQDESGLLDRLAQAFGLAESKDRESIAEAVYRQNGVLYLDNLEDVLDDAAARARLRQLATAPHLTMLASSREVLQQSAHDIALPELELDAAALLFRDQWQAPLDDSPELRAFLKQDLGQHALSIVLVAAQRSHYPTLGAVRAAWQQQRTQLARLKDGADKLTNLDVSISLSLDAVRRDSEAAVTLWGLCAFFPEGMSQTAFERVTDSFADQATPARHVLVDLSVAQLDPNRTLTMLAPLRQFVLEQAQAGRNGLDPDALTEIGLHYFSALIVAAKQYELGDDTAARGATLDALLPEFPNLREFMCLTAPRSAEWLAQISALSRLLQNLYQYRALISIEILRTLLPLQIQAGRDLDTAFTIETLGDLERRLGAIDDARTHYEQAIALYRQERDNLGLANSFLRVAILDRESGNLERAGQLLNQALAWYTNERDMMGYANTCAELARVAHARGQEEQADEYLGKAMDAAQATQAPGVVQYVMGAIKEIHPGWLREQQLREFTQAALQAIREQNADASAVEQSLRAIAPDDKTVAAVLGDLAYRLRMENQFSQAEPFYRRALELDSQNPRRYIGLVMLLRQTAREQEALALTEQWLAVSLNEVDALIAAANLSRKFGNEQKTAEYISLARAHAGETEWYARACIEAVAGNTEAALDFLERASAQKDFDKAWAARDLDLEWIREEARFKEIVGVEE